MKDLSKYWVDEETPYIHEDKVIELINQARIDELNKMVIWAVDKKTDRLKELRKNK